TRSRGDSGVAAFALTTNLPHDRAHFVRLGSSQNRKERPDAPAALVGQTLLSGSAFRHLPDVEGRGVARTLLVVTRGIPGQQRLRVVHRAVPAGAVGGSRAGYRAWWDCRRSPSSSGGGSRTACTRRRCAGSSRASTGTSPHEGRRSPRA